MITHAATFAAKGREGVASVFDGQSAIAAHASMFKIHRARHIHLAAGPGGIFLRRSPGERGIAAAMVDAGVPDDEAWMVAVAANHGAEGFLQIVQPFGVADIHPRRPLFQCHQTKLVEHVEKIRIVGIMGEPHPIDADGLDLLRIAAVQAVGNGVADEWPGLMAVDTEEFEMLAV